MLNEIKAIAKFVGTGTTPSTKNKSNYKANDICFFKPGDFIEGTVNCLTNSINYISESARNEARIFPKNSILCTCIGTIGKIGIVVKESSCNQQINYVVVNEQHDPKFIAYSLLAKFKMMKESFNNSSVVSILKKSDFEKIKIFTYSKDKEIEIKSTLDSIDYLISTKKSQYITLNELIKSRFNEMFEETNLSMQKEEWSTLSSVAIVYSGTTPNTSEPSYWNGNILWVTPAEINDDSYIINTTQRKITETGKNSKSLSLMPEGTVLFSTRAPIGKVAIAGKPMTCNQGFKNFYCSDKINPIYLYFLLKSNIEFMQSIGTGSTFKEISRSKISNVKIPVPPIDMQNNFASFFKRIDKLKFIVQKQIDDLTELFNEKMDEYFNCDEEV